MPRSKATAQKLERNIDVDFARVAKEIVQRVRAQLLAEVEQKQHDVLRRLKPPEIEAIAATVGEAFARQKMGLLELSILARRELGVLAIRRTVARFSTSWLSSPKGVGPAEYFNRYYEDLFRTFELPAAAVNIVDPNLHFHLKRRKEFKQISGSRAAPLAQASVG